jgi:hypothetical protein
LPAAPSVLSEFSLLGSELEEVEELEEVDELEEGVVLSVLSAPCFWQPLMTRLSPAKRASALRLVSCIFISNFLPPEFLRRVWY